MIKNKYLGKITALLLAAALLLSGCGDQGSSSGSTTSGTAGQPVENLYQVEQPVWSDTASGKTYYVSASAGKDGNDGLSEEAPATVKTLSGLALAKGDRVLFKAGDQFELDWKLTASGTKEEPIVISSYGSGKKPVLSGAGIALENAGGYIISGLEFTGGSYGIRIQSGQSGLAPIQITKCDFRDLKADQGETAQDGKITFADAQGFAGTGIALNAGADKALTNLTVDNCSFYNLTVGIGALPVVNNVYTKSTAAVEKLTGMFVHDCAFEDVTGAAAILLAEASRVQIASTEIAGTGLNGTGKADSAGLRLSGTKDVTVQGTVISDTYAYGNGAKGAGVLFEGANEKLTFQGCTIKDNIGNAFESSADGVFGSGKTEAAFDDCRLLNNNTAQKGGNTAYAAADSTVSIKGGEIALQNDEQAYQDKVSLDKTVNVYNASGTALQGSLPADADISTVKLGVGRAKLTPEERTFLWGYTNPDTPQAEQYSYCDPATDILDDTWIKVMVFEDTQSKNRIAFIICDMCTITDGEQVPEGTYARWAQKAGVAQEQLYVSTTHTHQATGILEEKYIAWVDKALEEAVDSMEPVKMGVTITSDDVAVSRRPSLAINEKLAFDNTLLLASFTSVKTGKPVSYLSNIAIHNTSLGNGRLDNAKYNTSELTGNAMAYIENQMGEGFTSVFMNGAYGDAGPNVYGDYQAEYETIVKRAEELGRKIHSILQNLPAKSAQGVKGATTVTRLNYRPQEDMYFTGAHVGELAFFGVSGEIFSSIGAVIKEASPFPYTITTANTNAFHSYMPSYTATKDGLGGYGVTEANHYRDTIEAFVEENAAKVLDSLVEDSPKKLEVKSVMGAEATQANTPKAFDNDATTCWETGSIADGWFQCDLGETKEISKVSINFGDYSRRDPAGKYDILVSDSKSFETYTVYGSADGNSACGQTFAKEGVKGRYVRFVAREFTKESSTIKVYEVSVFGK